MRDVDTILSPSDVSAHAPRKPLENLLLLLPGWSRSAIADDLGYPTPVPSPSWDGQH